MCLIESHVIAILPAVFHPDVPAHAADCPNLYHPIPQKCLKSVKSSISGSYGLYTDSDRHRRKGGSVIRIHTKKRPPSRRPELLGYAKVPFPPGTGALGSKLLF